jgi:hypothetical protein
MPHPGTRKGFYNETSDPARTEHGYARVFKPFYAVIAEYDFCPAKSRAFIAFSVHAHIVAKQRKIRYTSMNHG